MHGEGFELGVALAMRGISFPPLKQFKFGESRTREERAGLIIMSRRRSQKKVVATRIPSIHAKLREYKHQGSV